MSLAATQSILDRIARDVRAQIPGLRNTVVNAGGFGNQGGNSGNITVTGTVSGTGAVTMTADGSGNVTQTAGGSSISSGTTLTLTPPLITVPGVITVLKRSKYFAFE